MLLGTQTDWAGIAAVVAAVFSGIATVLATMNGRKANNIVAAVTTPPEKETLGVTMQEVSDTLDHVHAVVCGDKVAHDAPENEAGPPGARLPGGPA